MFNFDARGAFEKSEHFCGTVSTALLKRGTRNNEVYTGFKTKKEYPCKI
jgi:hypothetical protein